LRKILLFAAALSTLSCATVGTEASRSASSDGAELTGVIDAVREVIVEAETRDVKGFPPLKAITVKLQTTVSRSAGGEVRYLVIAVGGSASSDSVSTLELDMKPPEVPKTQTLLPKESLKDALAQAIHLAKIGVAQAAKGEPPLAMKAITIEQKFTVTLQGSAGVKVLLSPVGLDASGSISRARAHTVKLEFGP